MLMGLLGAVPTSRKPMATNTTSVPLFSWDGVQASKVWLALTPQQRVWCVAWLASGRDYLAATRWAYPALEPKSIVPMSHQVRQNKNVLQFCESQRRSEQRRATQKKKFKQGASL